MRSDVAWPSDISDSLMAASQGQNKERPSSGLFRLMEELTSWSTSSETGSPLLSCTWLELKYRVSQKTVERFKIKVKSLDCFLGHPVVKHKNQVWFSWQVLYPTFHFLILRITRVKFQRQLSHQIFCYQYHHCLILLLSC